MVSHISAQSASLFSLQIAAPVFAFLATQEVLYRLFEKAMLDSSQDPNHTPSGKGRIGAFAIAGGILAGASIVMPSSTILYLTIGTISCLALLALRLTRKPTQITAPEPAPTPAVPTPTLPSTPSPQPAPMPPSNPVIPPATSPEMPRTYTPTQSLDTYAALEKHTLWGQVQQETDLFFGQQTQAFFTDAGTSVSTAVRFGEQYYPQANWVGLDLTTQRLIATRYPMHSERRHHPNRVLTSTETSMEVEEQKNFWKTAYLHNALIIDLHEKIKDEKHFYYPTNHSTHYYGDRITVQYLESDGSITNYRVTYGSDEKTITRYTFPFWPDGDVISVPALTDLIKDIQCHQVGWRTSLIHCYAGLGRTGTLIAALIIKEKVEKKEITHQNLHYHLVQIVITLRTQKHQRMVHTQEQFNLLYEYATSLLHLSTTGHKRSGNPEDFKYKVH